jgi:hypothetical protein
LQHPFLKALEGAQMSVTITLPAGATEVTVREIPRLFAEALHPEALDGTKKIVTRLMRQAKDPDAIPSPRCDPLTPGDWALLAGIWSHLPVFKEGMPEAEWLKYAEAFESAQRQPDWQLVIFWSGVANHGAVHRLITADEHRAEIPRAVAAGELIVRSRSRIPIPQAIGEQLESGIVILDDFVRYARGLGVMVRADSSGAPSSGVAAPAPGAAPNTRASKGQIQEEAILDWLLSNNYDAKKLPKHKVGTPGTKSSVRAAMLKTPAIFSTKSFEHAWERLRNSKEIIDAT